MTWTTLWDYQTGKIWDCKKDMSMTLQKIKMILQIWLNRLRCVQHMSFRMGTKFLSEMTIINDILAAYPIWLLKCLCLWVCVCMCICMDFGFWMCVCVDVSVIYRYPSSKTYIMCMHKMLTKRRHTSGVEHAKQKPTTTTTTTNVDEWVNLKIRLFPWLDIQSCLFTSFVGSSIVEIICYPSNLLQYLEKYYIY